MTNLKEAQRKLSELQTMLILLLEEMEQDLEDGVATSREAEFNNHKLKVTLEYDEKKQERYGKWWFDDNPVEDHNDLLLLAFNLPLQRR